ncbi:MAG: hydrogen peroxide-inducible genes activator [Alphaproteobacteria bacterium]|nr:hydrogen peroxide-inducible genes activator [Alphaproteobacteria bacterium]
MPTLTQLQYIVAVHRTGHFGRAAAECEVSQPTLSAQVAKAEEQLGVVLFDRRTTPVTPTEPGRRLIAAAQDVLAAHARLMDAADSTAGLTGSFTLGVIPTLAPTVLPWFLRAFTEACPKVELTVLERTTDGIVAALLDRQMDAGLVATPLGEPGLDRRVVFYDPFYVYAHPESSILARDEVALADIERDDLWLLEDGHCFRNQVVHLCGANHRALLGNVRFEAGSFDTLRGLIDQVGGFTLVPETYAQTLPRDVRLAQVRPFADPVPIREVSLVAQRRHWKGAILDALADTLRVHAPRCLPREAGTGNVLPVDLDD